MLFPACESPKSSREPSNREESDPALEAILQYKKLKAEGKLPTPEQEAESLRVLNAKNKENIDTLSVRVKEVARACREKHNDAEAYKACLKEREPLIFSDGKERDDCIHRGKYELPVRVHWHSLVQAA